MIAPPEGHQEHTYDARRDKARQDETGGRTNPTARPHPHRTDPQAEDATTPAPVHKGTIITDAAQMCCTGAHALETRLPVRYGWGRSGTVGRTAAAAGQ